MSRDGQHREEPPGSSRISEEIRAREFFRENVSHVAVEGVIGAGKTTLARLLAGRLGARLVLEPFDENPFLDRFYENPDRWAFHTQLSFLASRFRQQSALLTRDLFHDLVVCDYTLEKDRIFARITLDGDELQLHETLYRTMERRVPAPDLVVYLRATPEKLLGNIRKRGRPFEASITRSYLQELVEAYDDHYFHYGRSSIMIVNMEDVDFVDNPEAVIDLIRQIGNARYRGTIYFRADRPSLFDN